ncbi:hypothetical protein V1504DRAFT_460804 [Lipomyces starkeyi]
MWKVISLGRRKPSPREIRACDGCRSRKAKCSNSIQTQKKTRVTTQPCTRCQRSGRRCTYNFPVKDGDLPLESNPVRLQSNNFIDESQSVTFGPVIVPTPDATPTSFPPLAKPPESHDELQVPLDGVDTWTGDFWPVDDPTQEMNQDDRSLGLQNLLGIPSPSPNENAEDLLDITYPWIDSTPFEVPSTGETHRPVSLLTELLAAGEESCGEGALGKYIQNFLEHMYAAFPIVDKNDLVQRLANADVMDLDADFKILCFAIKMFTLVREYRMEPTRRLENMLVRHVEALEEERLMQGFADHPDIDTVVVSLFLFTAYNVLWKHNRAFLYLGEAIDLFDLVSRQIEEDQTLDKRRLRRLARLELVLFNTAAASYSIYGSRGTITRRKPILSPRIGILLLESPDPTEVHLDKLLLRLTHVHATSIAQNYPDPLLDISRLLQKARIPTDPSTADFAGVIQYPSERQPPSALSGILRQTADIHISHHWRALEKMALAVKSRNRDTVNMEEQRKLMQVLCDKGASALAWTGSVDKGTVRIIGLGKLASIALDIYDLAYGFRVGSVVAETCKTIIAGLLGTIVSLDYERAFADRLHNCIDNIMGNTSTPRFLECTSAVEPEGGILNEWPKEHLTPGAVDRDPCSLP